MNLRSKVFILMFAAPFMACGLTKAVNQAEVVAKQYFKALHDDDPSKIMALYSAQFFKETSEKKWKKTLKKIRLKTGKYLSHSTRGWHVSKGHMTKVTLRYSVKYQKVTMNEEFVVVQSTPKTAFNIWAHSLKKLETSLLKK